MTDSTVLSEFLIKIVYKEDEPSEKKLRERVALVAARAVKLAETFAAVSTGIAVAVTKIAENLSSLAYLAANTGTTTSAIESLKYAFEQAGVGAEKGLAGYQAFFKFVQDKALQSRFKGIFGFEYDREHPEESYRCYQKAIEGF